jgi:hypothetical protein
MTYVSGKTLIDPAAGLQSQNLRENLEPYTNSWTTMQVRGYLGSADVNKAPCLSFLTV